MALSSISTHKLACIFAPIDIPKIVYTILSLINPYCMLVIRATVYELPS